MTSADENESPNNPTSGRRPAVVTNPPEPLLTVRAFLVLLAALLAGVAAGVMGHFAGQNVPAACLVGGGAFAIALPLIHALLART